MALSLSATPSEILYRNIEILIFKNAYKKKKPNLT